MDTLLAFDKDLLVYLNGFHSPWLDPVMYWITKTWAWTPLYLVLLYLTIRDYKKNSWVPLAGIGLTILISDGVTSQIMKPFFERLRPSHEPSLQGAIHLVNGYVGGKYGFASSHAANTFGTAMFFWLSIRDRYRWAWALFLWAILMTYTRIYLGVHYPGDILAGCMVGLFGAAMGHLLSSKLKPLTGNGNFRTDAH